MILGVESLNALGLGMLESGMSSLTSMLLAGSGSLFGSNYEFGTVPQIQVACVSRLLCYLQTSGKPASLQARIQASTAGNLEALRRDASAHASGLDQGRSKKSKRTRLSRKAKTSLL